MCAHELEDIHVMNSPKLLTSRGQYAVLEDEKYWKVEPPKVAYLVLS